MKGIEDLVWLQVGELERITPIADEDLERENDEKTSAVHFLRFELTVAQITALKNGTPLFAGVDHEAYPIEKICGSAGDTGFTDKRLGSRNTLNTTSIKILLGNHPMSLMQVGIR
jgi:hypothetical protein